MSEFLVFIGNNWGDIFWSTVALRVGRTEQTFWWTLWRVSAFRTVHWFWPKILRKINLILKLIEIKISYIKFFIAFRVFPSVFWNSLVVIKDLDMSSQSRFHPRLALAVESPFSPNSVGSESICLFSILILQNIIEIFKQIIQNLIMSERLGIFKLEAIGTTHKESPLKIHECFWVQNLLKNFHFISLVWI